MADADALLARLRADPGPLDDLVSLLVDDALGRPVRELVDPAQVATALTEGLRASAADPRTAEWIRGQVSAALTRTERLEGRLRDRVPPEIVAPLKDLLRRPYTPDRALVRDVLDHPAMRKALRGVLQDTLVQFSGRVGSVLGEASRLPGGRAFAGILGAARGVASAVTGEMERALQGRVGDFLDDVIGHAADVWVSQLTSDRLAPEMADFRAHLVDAILDQPVDRYRAEVVKMDPDRAVDDVSAIVTAVANWEGLGDAVESGVRQALDVAGERSVRDLLDGSGLEEGWRPHLEAGLREQARRVVGTEAFAGWLAGVVADAEG